ncbi:MAG TPA: hypothetical protein VHZ54_04590 [Solirubrobacterales bacterium]|nr:hypothetical protein [Solirubrobacterales bacterium]
MSTYTHCPECGGAIRSLGRGPDHQDDPDGGGLPPSALMMQDPGPVSVVCAKGHHTMVDAYTLVVIMRGPDLTVEFDPAPESDQ